MAEQKKLREFTLEREKLEAEFEGKTKKESHERELLTKKLTDDAETAKEDSNALRKQLSCLMDQLREEKKARDNANDIRECGANIGIIVSSEMPEEYGEMYCLEAGVWIVKPKLARALASAMRNQIISV